MIARLFVSFGLVAAAVGFTIFGMATSYAEHDSGKANVSYILMAAGLVAAVIGGFWYRAEERRAEAETRMRSSAGDRP